MVRVQRLSFRLGWWVAESGKGSETGDLKLNLGSIQIDSDLVLVLVLVLALHRPPAWLLADSARFFSEQLPTTAAAAAKPETQSHRE